MEISLVISPNANLREEELAALITAAERANITPDEFVARAIRSELEAGEDADRKPATKPPSKPTPRRPGAVRS